MGENSSTETLRIWRDGTWIFLYTSFLEGGGGGVQQHLLNDFQLMCPGTVNAGHIRPESDL
jgi:hypothetical protein